MRTDGVRVPTEALMNVLVNNSKYMYKETCLMIFVTTELNYQVLRRD